MASRLQIHNGRQDGFSTLEILLAIGVVMLFLTAIFVLSFGNQTVASESQSFGEVQHKAQAQLEDYRAIARNYFLDATTTPRVLDNASDPNDPYYKQIVVSDISPCLKQVTSIYDWTGDHQKHATTSLSELLTDPATYFALDGACNITPPPPTNDWHDPLGATAVARGGFGDVDAIAIAQINKELYVTLGANSANKQDIGTVDVTNLNPITGTGAVVNSVDEGVLHYNDIAVGHDSTTGKTYAYLYVGNDANNQQFQVVDVSNPTHISTSTIIRTLPGVTSSGNGGGAIYFWKNKVYIGIGFTTGDEFHVYCVGPDPNIPSCASSSPINPVWVGSYPVGHNVYQIIVRDQLVGGVMKTLAYLGQSSNSSGQPELQVYDVTNPTGSGATSHITKLGPGFIAPGNEYGTALYLSGNTAFLGRQSGADPNFYAIDISNPAAPTSCSSCHFTITGQDINGVVVAGGFAFLQTNNGLHVLNVSSVSTMHAPSTSPNGIFLAGHGINGLATDGNLVFATSPNQGSVSLYVIYSGP